MANKSFQEEYESIGTFLILELLALVCFGLGGVNLIFQYAGFIVALISTFFAFRNYSKDDLKPILLIAAPLFLMSIFTSFGHFLDIFGYSVVTRLGAFLSLISFLAIGLSARRLKSFSAKNALLCIGGGFALITLVSTIITWSQYGMFYPLIYKNTPSYYYDGNLYSITNEMSWLNGFKVVEVSQNYGGLFGLLCACALTGLLFLKPKENKVAFTSLSVIGGIGLISIISIPNFYALVFLAITFAVACYYRFLRNNSLANKILHYAVLVAAGIAVIMFLFAILNVSVPGVAEAIANASFLNRIFNANRIMIVANPILEASLKPFNLFGINTVTYYEGYILPTSSILSVSGSFEVEVIKEGGILAFLLFIAFAVLSVFSFGRYLKQGKDDEYIKVVFLSILVGFTLYLSICDDVFPITHSPTSYYPFTQSLPFMIIIFIIGYTILPMGKAEINFKDAPKKEKPEDKKKYFDDDYSFSDVEEEEYV